MRKPLKIVAILVAVVIGLLALIAIGVLVFVDPNRYRDDIIQTVKQQTGRDLTIEGDLSLSLFPWIGLETDRLVLSNAPGFGKEPMAVIASSETKVELLPLLRKQVVVDAVRLNGLKLNLARNAKGQTNWDDLVKPDAAGKPEPKAEPKQDPSAGAALAAFTINRFEVRNSEFTWRDAQAGTSYAARNVSLTSGDVLGSTPVPLQLAFDLESGKPAIKQRVKLDARLRADLEKELLEVPKLDLAVGDLALNAQLQANNILSAPTVKGALEVPPFNPRPLLQQFNVAYAPADAMALQRVGLAANVQHDPKATALSDLRVTLDETQLTGKLSVRNQPSTAYRFDLALDGIDIDRYLPPPAKTEKQDTKTAGPEAALAPLALLKDTDAEGELRIGKLKAGGIRSQDIVAKVTARDGRVTLANQAKLYQGTVGGRIVVDASSKVPQFRFEEKLAGVQMGPLLTDADLFERFSGTGNVDLNLTAQGLDANAIKRTLSGTAGVQMRDGKIQGVNLQKLVLQARQAIAQVRGREVDGSADAGDETVFSNLSANARVTKGVAQMDDIRLDGPVVRAQGAGTANLVEESLDYRLQVTLAEDATREGSTIPVKVYGPFADPKFRIDVSSLLKERIKPAEEKLEKKLEEKKEELRDKFRDKLLERLKR